MYSISNYLYIIPKILHVILNLNSGLLLHNHYMCHLENMIAIKVSQCQLWWVTRFKVTYNLVIVTYCMCC